MNELEAGPNPLPYPRTAAIVAIAALVLGVYGHLRLPPMDGNVHNFWDALYGTLQFYTMNGGLPPGDKPWSLELSRLLCILVFFYGVRAVLVVFIKKFRDELKRPTGHLLVLGASKAGIAAGRSFTDSNLAKGRQSSVVFIDDDRNRLDRAEKAVPFSIGWQGWPSMGILSRKGRLDTAREILVTTDDELANISIAGEVNRALADSGSPPKTCHIMTERLAVNAAFREMPIFERGGRHIIPTVFNMYDNAARAALRDHPLDGEGIRRDDPRRPHLMIVGFGRMGEALLVQTAKTGHYANGKKVRVTVIDPDGDRLKQELLWRYPGIGSVLDIDFINRVFAHESVGQALVSSIHNRDLSTSIALCCPDNTTVMEQALRLPQTVIANAGQILLRMDGDIAAEIIPEWLANSGNVAMFGNLDSSCSLDGEIDRLARTIHEKYRETFFAKHPEISRDVIPDDRPSLQPWERLDFDFRDSNRQQADHIPVKLRAVGAVAVDKDGTESNFTFTSEEIELLAEVEHNRWCADRILAGWLVGDKTDRSKRISADLVPYGDLPQDVKQYDRDAIGTIPALLSEIGKIIIKKSISD